MEKNPDKKKEEALSFLILMFPALMLVNLAGDMGEEIPEIVMACILGFVGMITGFPLFYLTKDRSRKTKYLTLGLLFVTLIAVMALIVNRTDSEKRDLLTCAVCGYKALERKGAECEVCLVEVNEDFMQDEFYESLEELVRGEQLEFFALRENVNLNEPEVYTLFDSKYRKDENWQPIVTIEEIEKTRAELLDFGDSIEIEVIGEEIDSSTPSALSE